MIHPDPIIRRIHVCALASVPVNLVGPPGGGKTARVKAYAAMRSLHLERWLLSRCEPIDLKPRVERPNGDIDVVSPPEIRRLDEHKGGVLFLDEFNRAAKETENSALDHCDNPPENVIVIAACNPPSQGQSARSLGSQTANRFCHLPVEPDPLMFARAIVSGWDMGGLVDVAHEAAGAGLDANMAWASSMVSAYIRRQPDELEIVPKTTLEAGAGWPSPRSWDAARKVLAWARTLKLDEGSKDATLEDTFALLVGLLGPGVGGKFAAFVDARDLPDPEEWLKDPSAVDVSAWRDRLDRTVAALTGVQVAVQLNFTNDRWKAAWAIVGAIVDQGQKDAGMVGSDMLQDLYLTTPKEKLNWLKIARPATLMHRDLAKMILDASRQG